MKNSAVWQIAVFIICALLFSMYYVEEHAITVKMIVVGAIGVAGLLLWVINMIRSKFEDD